MAMTLSDKIASRVWKDSGATWNYSDASPVHGYMVSMRETEYVCSVYEFGPDVVEAYVATTPLPKGDYFYGAWVEDGKVYLDVSINVTTRDEAMMIADLEDQLAVFDVYTGTVVQSDHLATA